MRRRTDSTNAKGATVQGFGFDPNIEAAHFRVDCAADGETVCVYDSLSEQTGDGLRLTLRRDLWDAIAPAVTDEYNRRLRGIGLPRARWASTGATYVARVLGKELLVLAWAIEEEEPAKVPTAIANWLALLPEERWWLHTMASTASKSAGDRRGWRCALRFALCETEPPSAAAERASIVEYLRSPCIDGIIEEACVMAADQIERGEHRRKEEK